MKKSFFAFALMTLLAGSVFAADGDEFMTSLDAARSAYEKGDMETAREELDYAKQLLGQMRAKNLESLMPEPLAGWTRESSESNAAAGLAMFGGGTTSEAKYKRDRDTVTITIVTDSPMITSMGMLFNNPALAGANGQMKRLKGQKALIKEDGEITTLVNGRAMVTVKGKAPAADLEAYFKAVDFKKLEAF